MKTCPFCHNLLTLDVLTKTYLTCNKNIDDHFISIKISPPKGTYWWTLKQGDKTIRVTNSYNKNDCNIRIYINESTQIYQIPSKPMKITDSIDAAIKKLNLLPFI